MHTAVRRISLALATLTLLAACADEPSPTAPNTFIVPLFANGASDGTSHHAVASLSGDEEVPPVDTRAVGNAIFWLSEDGTELRYRVITSRMEDITQVRNPGDPFAERPEIGEKLLRALRAS